MKPPTSEFIQRLIRFYDAYKDGVEPSRIWKDNIAQFHAHLDSALVAKDEAKVREYLDNFAGFGVTGMEDPASIAFDSERFGQKRLRLCESTGTIPIQNPEQPCDRATGPVGLGLGFDYWMPDFLGFKCGDYGVPARMMNYAAIAHSCDLLLNGLKDKSVCEIGPGLGFMGYILNQKEAREYHTIDLSTTSVVCAYASAHWIKEDSIWLCGEEYHPKPYFMHVWPCNVVESIHEHFHLILNSDSLPEMTQQQQFVYYEFIRNKAEWFVSVNHESRAANQMRVLPGAKNAGLVLRARHPFWMRDGYVFEVYSAI